MSASAALLSFGRVGDVAGIALVDPNRTDHEYRHLAIRQHPYGHSFIGAEPGPLDVIADTNSDEAPLRPRRRFALLVPMR